MEEKIEEGVLNSRVDVAKNKQFAIAGLLTWVLILLAIFSCIWRNDCNVLVGLLIVLLLNRKFSLNPELYSKIIIHLLVALIIIDCIWMFIMFPYWNKTENEKFYSTTVNHLHGWVEFFGVLELLVKGCLIFILITIYKNFNGISGLFNFKYS